MDLNITKWYVRLFFWSLGMWDRFWHGWDTGHRYEQRTNLCHFVRVICVWMPLVLALHVALGLATAFVLVALPIRFFGWGTYLPTLMVLGLIAVLVGAIILAVVILKAWQRGRERKEKQPRPYTPRVRKEREPGIWQILATAF